MTYVAFDLLYADGRDLRALPLEERKAQLEALIVPDRGVLYSKHIVGRGKEFFALAQREQLEGIMAKRRDSPYRTARSRDWVKIKAKHEQEFVVGGWTEPKGSRRVRRAAARLLRRREARLRRSGRHRIQSEALARDRRRAAQARAQDVAVRGGTAHEARPHFVKPELVAQVAFAEWTDEGLLRQPVFLGLRPDKPASEVTRERAQPSLRPA